MIVVDGANVVGSRPNGWWRDRAGAARDLVSRIGEAVDDGRLPSPVTVVLEGAARHGAPAVADGPVRVVHAAGPGDDTLVAEAAAHPDAVLVTSDRELQGRARAVGARIMSVRWLLDRVDRLGS